VDVGKILDVFDRGLAANWVDPFRNGNLVELPSRGDLFFTGDLHGSMENFSLILKYADLKNHPDRHLILHEVVHQLELGQDQSFRLLEKVAALKAKYPKRVHFLMGNHDLAEVQGREIFKGGICLNLLFDNAVEHAYGKRKEEVKAKYMEFLKTIPLAARTKHGVFLAHSTPEGRDVPAYSLSYFTKTPEPSDYLPHSLMEKMIWGRDYAPATADAFAERVGAEVFLVGHTPCTMGFNTPNHRHVILDSKERFGTYLLLPLDRPLGHEEIKDRIRFLRPKVGAAKR